MLASPVRVDGAIESDVGRLVPRKDRARALDGHVGLQGGNLLVVASPAIVEVDSIHAFETARNKGPRAAEMQAIVARIHGGDVTPILYK
jgi:hypothetical protein